MAAPRRRRERRVGLMTTIAAGRECRSRPPAQESPISRMSSSEVASCSRSARPVDASITTSWRHRKRPSDAVSSSVRPSVINPSVAAKPSMRSTDNVPPGGGTLAKQTGRWRRSRPDRGGSCNPLLRVALATKIREVFRLETARPRAGCCVHHKEERESRGAGQAGLGSSPSLHAASSHSPGC
jgi:hypothetical protein